MQHITAWVAVLAFGVAVVVVIVVAIMDRDDDWGGKVIGLKPLPTEGGKEFLFTDAFPEAVEA